MKNVNEAVTILVKMYSYVMNKEYVLFYDGKEALVNELTILNNLKHRYKFVPDITIIELAHIANMEACLPDTFTQAAENSEHMKEMSMSVANIYKILRNEK